MKTVVASGVTKIFGGFTAVDGVDVEVASGEVVGLVGANGAGKTTLIRMLLGLLEPTSGSVRLFGQSHSRAQRRRIGYVPQNLGLYRDLTANENLEFLASSFGVSPANSEERSNALVANVSLGSRRKLAFAAATQHRPDLLILDEPTSGVSPLARSHLWGEIRRRSEAGTAVLVSTHYMDEADQADRIVLMSHGRVEGRGSVHEIVGDRRVVSVDGPDWSEAFAALDRDDRLLTLAGTEIRVLGASPHDVRQVLDRAGVTAVVSEVSASLEETMALLAR